MDAMTAAMPSMGGTVLPESMEDQVQLGCRMIESAFSAACSARDQEIRKLRAQLDDMKVQISNLQRKNNAMENELHENNVQVTKITEENKELFKDVRELRTESQKLQGLKKGILQQLQDPILHDALADDKSQASWMAGGGGAGDTSYSAVQPSLPYGGASYARDLPGGSFNPNTAAVCPQASQPPDGKEFFRQAREKLDLKSFQDFLSQIKMLNNHQQTREETLKQVRRIMGKMDYLYRDFELLLNKHSLGSM